MKIVVDTNVVFSSLLNPNGILSEILLNSSEIFEFCAPKFLLDELEKHRHKLLDISGISEKDLDFLQISLYKKIEFIDLEFIQNLTWERALELTKNVDEFDAPFVALALELDSNLWTSDKKLINGLTKKGVDWIFTTDKIKEVRNAKM